MNKKGLKQLMTVKPIKKKQHKLSKKRNTHCHRALSSYSSTHKLMKFEPTTSRVKDRRIQIKFIFVIARICKNISAVFHNIGSTAGCNYTAAAVLGLHQA